jgi:hypothetical protein
VGAWGRRERPAASHGPASPVAAPAVPALADAPSGTGGTDSPSFPFLATCAEGTTLKALP